jgi:phosphatidylinositol alpha-1,6-mannosyltransferase
MQTPAFSVIIAVYNGARMIRRAIDSVLNQNWPTSEIIVVDDGSTDGTAEEVRCFNDAVRYIYQPHSGVSAARNRGAAEARGDWLVFLDADDWYYPDRLRWHAEWIMRDPKLDFLTGNFDYVRPDGSFIRRSMESAEIGRRLLKKAAGKNEVIMAGDELGKFVEEHFGDMHTLTLPRRTFLELGGYPAGVSVCEDVNFLIRLCARSCRVGVVCQPMAAYVIHEKSATRSNPLRAQRETLKALLPLERQLVATPSSIRLGLKGAVRRARLDLASVSLRCGRRLEAVGAVIPLLWNKPGLKSLRDVLSVLVGTKEKKGDIPSNRNRFLVITELFLPTKGGTAVWFDEVYRRIGGKEIHIICADVPGAKEHDANHSNSIHRLKLRRYRWFYPESLWMYLKLLMKALRLTLRHQFDAVHAGRVLPEGLVGWIVAGLIRRPLVIYAHGEENTTWRAPRKFKAMVFTYLHADKIIANSEFTLNELLKVGVKPERIVLISPGVDTNRFRPDLEASDLRASLGVVNGQKLILSVGRLSRRKGFDQVIRSLPQLAAKGIDAQYVIVGTGQDHDYLNSLARQMDVSNRVHLLGHVSSEDLPRWYNAADVFAMPNRDVNNDTEGFGIVYLEAAACGKPSVAGRSGGTGSAVIDGVTGFRVDGESADNIAFVLESLLKDSDLARQIGAKGREHARNFSWDSVAEQISSLWVRE